ncbi:hypothetical protein [Haliangium sp.]|uniref:hypothetical protein n=1 Tax=Haliangium sp. TaxID=2663208 RepID=UPI003D123E0F
MTPTSAAAPTAVPARTVAATAAVATAIDPAPGLALAAPSPRAAPTAAAISPWRRLLAMAGSLLAAMAIPLQLTLDHGSEKATVVALLMIPTALSLLAAGLLHSRYLGAQMLARATWWSNLILGTLISTTGAGEDAMLLGLMLTLGSGGALLVMGRAGLGAGSVAGRFRPVAFRGALIVAMVMALADTQSLLLFGGMTALDYSPSFLPLVCAVVMIVAVIGLFRLAVWGLALNLLANLAIAALGLCGVLGLPEPIVAALVTTAALQLLLPLPLLRAFVRGASHQARAGRNWWPLLAAVVSALMALSVYALFVHQGRLIHF